MAKFLDSLPFEKVSKAFLNEFTRRRVGSINFYVSDCVAYTPAQLKGVANVLAASSLKAARWSGGRVPYRFAAALTPSQRDAYREAAEMWNESAGNRPNGKPMIQIVEATANDTVVVSLRANSNQSNTASTGRLANGNYVDIGRWDVGSIAHEFGHVLGLIHEHQRPDRASFVRIVPIEFDNKPNFRKHSAGQSQAIGTYDFESIMHYAPSVVAPDGTIVLIDPLPAFQSEAFKMGQRVAPSAADIAGIRQIYAAA